MSEQKETCMAYVHSSGSWHGGPCAKKAKHVATVKPGRFENGTEPFTVHVCGTHHNMLEKGRGLTIVTGQKQQTYPYGYETKSVLGIESDVNKLRREADMASDKSLRAYNHITFCARLMEEQVVRNEEALMILEGMNDALLTNRVEQHDAAVREHASASEEAKIARAKVDALEGGK